MEAFLLDDRIAKIRSIDGLYDLEHNAYISYSAGKDSNVLSALIDIALPGNTIPRVYVDTGIELSVVRQFALDKEKSDHRFTHIKPSKNIRDVLETYGYPFKSKEHSYKLDHWQKGSRVESLLKYFSVGDYADKKNSFGCPQKLRYQTDESFHLHVSDRCCYKLKKEPAKKWAEENHRPIAILGLRAAEGGQRGNKTGCVAFEGNTLKHFSPLMPMDDLWIDWFIKTQNISLPSVYGAPYNFKRTGCKGCPFNTNLQKDLETLQQFFPSEARQCEGIWKPVYDEYRRIGYRLTVYKSEGQYEFQFGQ